MEPSLVLVGFFLFALGACVGSFLNVVIWRLPYKLTGATVTFQGKTAKLSLSWPPSHCPHCDTGIPWYLNLPIFGWFILAGRCANCRKPIAIRYPLVELATACLFLAPLLSYQCAGLYPGWVSILHDWPALLLHLFFIAALLAASGIDADSYIIPLIIPGLVSAAAILSAPFIDSKLIPTLAPAQWDSLAKPVIGAAAGLILANILLFFRLLPLSFAGPTPEDGDGKKSKHSNSDKSIASKTTEENPKVHPLPQVTRKLAITLTVLLSITAVAVLWLLAPAAWASAGTTVAGVLIFLVGVLPRDEGTPDVTGEVMEEISGPGARREILKELLFVLFPAAFALLAAALPMQLPYSVWLARLLGVAFGFMVGGGSIWLVRILGTLYKGIEAMGLGDVHLMAAAGAILGCPLVLVAFPLFAPILALAYAAIRFFTHRQTILPFGPWLAMASILTLLAGEPILRWYLTLLNHN